MRKVTRLAAALIVPVAACASRPEEAPREDLAARFIAKMDAMPVAERLPHWDETRALMMRPAPRVGDEAPDFELARRDGGGNLRLSSLLGDRPVVLIFGSFT